MSRGRAAAWLTGVHRNVVAALVACGLVGACAGAPQQGLPELTGTIEAVSPAAVGIVLGGAVRGSGFRLAGTRLVATAAHVLGTAARPAAAGDAVVVRAGGRDSAAHVLRVNAVSDLALVELDAESGIPGLRLAPAGQGPRRGEWILVIGCPFGAEPTATVGIISALPGAIEEPARLKGLVQLNAAVNPGNSGGPVVNLRGEVVGVAYGSIPGGFGLGFAAPASELRALIAR